MSEKLCSCPFCGSEPRIYQTQWAIKCADPHCSVKPSVYSNDRDVAVTRWNSRPPCGTHKLDENCAKNGDYICIVCGWQDGNGEVRNVD